MWFWVIIVCLVLLVISLLSTRPFNSYRIVPVRHGQFHVQKWDNLFGQWRGAILGRDWVKNYCLTLKEAEELVSELKEKDRKDKEAEKLNNKKEKMFRKENPIRYY